MQLKILSTDPSMERMSELTGKEPEDVWVDFYFKLEKLDGFFISTLGEIAFTLDGSELYCTPYDENVLRIFKEEIDRK